MEITPVILTGKIIQLEPLKMEHAEQLVVAAQSEEIWEHTLDKPRDIEKMRSYIQRALGDKLQVPFAVKHLKEDRFIGSTRYWEIAAWRRGLQIGFTWFAREFWGSGVNAESKYLLMKYAFEDLNIVRVEFQTSTLNFRAQKALLALGAIEEGTLRARVVRPDGSRLDCIFYSILDTEWPAIKRKLESRILTGV
jgi:N-acetyltransferase